jgi:penicillin-binding protein 1A
MPGWRAAGAALVGLLLVGLLGLWALDAWYSGDLPSVQRLQAYRPATVTSVYAKDGSLMGEIYEQRRYVLPLDQIPDNLKNAFIAAEDANFYQHGGIDYMGIARAAGRNVLSGRFAQGGSTITQQVAKNFLLTSDRKLERKIKEALLAWRIEEAYDKDHILYLYLNEIFLGAQAYGVEAAARTFFGKSVKELTLGESAMLAGLPPRPSAWNPQADFAAAKMRQSYVLDQMLSVGFINERQSEEARKEEIHIAEHSNAFREAAPSFTEYVRRQLIEKYGEDKVLHDGLKVTTTCDPALQAVAQQALVQGVTEIDEKVGFRRDTIEHVDGDAAINARISEIEESLRQSSRRVEDDPASRAAKMTFTLDQVAQGVITKVSPTWAEVSVGRTVGILPLAWSTWVYPPDVARDWKYRAQDDFTRPIDANGDGVKEGGILRVGDVVRVRVKALSTTDEALAKVFAGTPGATTPYLGVRLVQPSELQGALLSFDVKGDEAGAVRSMVGGVDFDTSELNRAFQSRRQVGSTFKAIVYAAAIESKRLTAASIVPDAPLAFVTEEGTWKPENYGGDYRGNITLRQAITLSRNTSTVRVLDSCDPNMGRDVVYDFARRLGLGGPPTHALAEDFKSNPDTAWLCPWLPGVEGKHCTDAAPMPDGKSYCRACDLSIGLGSAALSVDEMARAFAVFASGGTWVEPYTLVKVEDRDGQVLEEHKPVDTPARVISPELSVIATWLLESVATNGTGAAAHRDLRVHVAGKTGTTNDEKDAWFIGYTPNTLTAVWVGYDQPKTIGLSATGGSVALPIWIDYMKAAVHGDTPFPVWAPVEWAQIDESTGRRVSSGGMAYPFLPGTTPEASSYTVGQATLEDLATEL